MNVCMQVKSPQSRHTPRLATLLVRLPESEVAEGFIDFCVSTAREHGASVRGLSIVDTRCFHELARTSESAASATLELWRLRTGFFRRSSVQSRFSTACRGAGVSFDLQQVDGAPCEIIKQQAHAYDLAIVHVPKRHTSANDNELTISDVSKLLHLGVGPVLAMRDRMSPPQRVLLVIDGSAASGRAVSSFVDSGAFGNVQMRLLAVSPTASTARSLLEKTAGKFQGDVSDLELGAIHGRGPQIIPAYARHWQADLIVMGTALTGRIARFNSGRTVRAVLTKTDCAIYTMS